LSPIALDAWLAGHPYLEPLARFTAEVNAAAGEIEAPRAAIPAWEDYARDFEGGLPLLKSDSVRIDLEPAGEMALALVRRLSARSAAGGPMTADISAVEFDLARRPDAPRRVVEWLLGDDSLAPASPGLLRYLGWTVMARYLLPVVEASGGWRNDERWLRNYCPTCGSAPAMAQLIGADPGRRRLLSCGCCGTRWQYKRTGCPFCENDSQRLASVTVEGEAGLRIDYCESCRGYLKTYDGQGNEAILLSDWTSLHLDLLAHDRGLKRLAVSLYELGPLLQPQA
jgi:FdhE protein